MTLDEARAALAALYDAEGASQWEARGARWKPLCLRHPDLYARAREARAIIAAAGDGKEAHGRPV